MMTVTQTEKRKVAKQLQSLANELRANKIEYSRLRGLQPTEDYNYYSILMDVERLANTFYYLENKIKKLKVEINYLRCLANKQIHEAKRTLAYNDLANSYTDFDDIDF